MRYSRAPSTVLLVLLSLLDLRLIFDILDHGWPKYIATDYSSSVRVVRVPFTWVDLVAVFALICLHAILIHGAWRVWRSPHHGEK